MRPYQRQALTTWGVVGAMATVGVALWWVGVRIAPVAFLLTMYLGASMFIAGYRWIRRIDDASTSVSGCSCQPDDFHCAQHPLPTMTIKKRP